MSEEYKSPWQIEHEKMLNQKEEEILAQKRRARKQFLRGLKITRKSDPKLTFGKEPAVETSEEQPIDETEESSIKKGKKKRIRRKKRKSKPVKSAGSVDSDEESPFNLEHLRKSWPILVVLMLLFFGSVYSLSPLNRISDFSVDGNTIVSSSDIANASELSMDDSIYEIYKKRASIESKVINSSPRIEKAELHIHFPNKVMIQIIEYQPIGYVEQKDKAYTILSNGSKLSESRMSTDEEEEDSLVLKDFSDGQVKQFALAYSELNPAIQSLIRTVTITPSQSTSDFITIEMADGNRVKVPLSQMKQKLPYYTSVAEQLEPPMTIDMEIGIFADSTPNYDQNFADDNPAGLSKSLSESKKAEEESEDDEETVEGEAVTTFE